MRRIIYLLILALVSSAVFSTSDIKAQEIPCNFDEIAILLQNMQEADPVDLPEMIEEAQLLVVALVENCTIEALEVQSTPEVQQLPQSTDDPLRSKKSDGFFLIGIDIAPGRWELQGSRDGCYWERTTIDGDIIANHFGLAGGTITLLETDFQLELNDCGEMIFVEDIVRSLRDDAAEPKDDGFYTVGVEIVPGLWRSTGQQDGCYYERLDDFQDIIANHYGMSGVTINILPSDYEVSFSDCGTWEYLGAP